MKCPKCNKSDEVVTRPDGTKHCLDCGERVVSGPSDATDCSQVAAAMMEWSKAWKVDGDLCRCRKCKRWINVSRMDEAMVHAAFCPQEHLIAPWQDLRSRIPANAERIRVDGKPE